MALPTLWRSTAKSTRISLAALIVTSSVVLVLKVHNLNKLEEPTKLHDITIPYIQLIPRHAITHPWVFVTSIFAEITILSYLVSATVLFFATNYIEKFWGYKEVLKFIVLVGSLTNLTTVMVAIVSNIFRNDVRGMDQPLGGGISYFFGFLVVLKQIIPEHNVVLFQGLINFRVKHIPFILLVIVSLWSLVISRSLYPAVPSVVSFFVSYNYLRFYQTFATDPLLPVTSVSGDQSNATITSGDASDAFLLVEFFPSAIKGPTSVVVNLVYDVSVLLGIVTPFNDEAVEQSNLRAQKISEQVSKANRLIANSVAERRRQVALQVIEDRVGQS